MTAALLSAHVVAAIVLIGPITAAASLFPRYGRTALAAAAPGSPPPSGAPDDSGGGPGGAAVARAMHRISAGYTVPAVAVPVFGIATAVQMGVLGEVWLWISMALTAAAAALLVAVIVPGQRRVLRALSSPEVPEVELDVARLLRRLSMVTGVFALIWVLVTILMIVRPGSSTGAGF